MQTFQQKLTRSWSDERRLVFGEGRPDHPPVMLIGEAPGAQEEEQGRPFVGKAGQNLNEFLQIVGLERADIWISNVVKARPFKVSDKGRKSNRPPNREELAFFTPLLREEIGLVKPRVIVTLGNVALQAVTGLKSVIGSMHGQPSPVTVNGAAFTLFPLYHPASVIYNRALRDVYLDDLASLRTYLNQREDDLG